MELHPAAGLSESALLRQRYLARLARNGADVHARTAGTSTVAQVLARLAGRPVSDDDEPTATLPPRLACAGLESDGVLREHARRGPCLASTPPIHRSTMAPRPWRRRGRPTLGLELPRLPWHGIAAVRRTSLLILVLLQTALAAIAMLQVLPYHGAQLLEIAQLVLFVVLIAWISAGFWTAIAGFLLHVRGTDRHALSALADAPLDPAARTAIVMPICNEDVTRVFAGLRATLRSVARSGHLAQFDFFILSDSSEPDVRVAEQAAWLDLCRDCGAFGRVFYRLRRTRIKRKSGNVADFCRRWGKDYRYMVVFDADSVMTGACLVRLVRLMEANPHAGIVQTAPHASGRDTLYARIQQFATRIYGPLFVAGMHFWQLGEAHYWGHNAIIRVQPFIQHCALARLPGRGSLSGEILSHDFVEAALMRRAGWGVWIAYDLPGSYEEMPPNLIDELKRDRRWCQGNLINSRLFFAHGLHPAHRAVFVTGVMAYASAPLWFAFLVLSTAVLALHTLVAPTYFTAPRQLFPLWPQWHPEWAVELFAATATMLFLPKVLGVACAMAAQPNAFGGRLRLAASALLEMIFSALLAPIRMLFHTKFVFTSLLGLNVSWKSPPRGDNETGWGEAFRRHGVHSVIGIGWAALVYRLNPEFLWWLLPVAGALALSIPLSVFSSRVALGRAARERRLFLIPEETAAPAVLRRLRRFLRRAPLLPRFVDAVVDPIDNALACAAEAARAHRSETAARQHRWLIERTLELGPGLLRPQDANALLGDAHALAALHVAVWTRETLAPEWAQLRLALPHVAPASEAQHLRRGRLAARLRTLIAQRRATPPARRSA